MRSASSSNCCFQDGICTLCVTDPTQHVTTAAIGCTVDGLCDIYDLYDLHDLYRHVSDHLDHPDHDLSDDLDHSDRDLSADVHDLHRAVR